jgi:hypothetical protein
MTPDPRAPFGGGENEHRLACDADTEAGLDWVPVRTDRVEEIDNKPGCLKPVLVPSNAPAAYTLSLVYEAKNALAALGRAGTRMRYWVVDADLVAPLLVTRGRPKTPGTVALVAPREDYPPAGTRAACRVGSMAAISLDASHVIGLGQWPVWYQEPEADDEEGSA